MTSGQAVRSCLSTYLKTLSMMIVGSGIVSFVSKLSFQDNESRPSTACIHFMQVCRLEDFYIM